MKRQIWHSSQTKLKPHDYKGDREKTFWEVTQYSLFLLTLLHLMIQ